MSIEAWQLCVLVTTGIVLSEFAVHAVLRRTGRIVLRKLVRTAALGLLAILIIVVGVVALGRSLADLVASLAQVGLAAVALWLTYRSYRANEVSDSAGTGAPTTAPATPPADDTMAASTGRHRHDNKS